MWRREIPHAIGIALGTVAGAVIIGCFSAAVLWQRLHEHRCSDRCPCRSTPEAADLVAVVVEAMEGEFTR